MKAEDTQKALKKAGLERLADSVQVLVQPAISLKAAPVKDEAGLKAGISKIGGIPDLPQGQQWPMKKDAPLSFVAQIRLDEVAPYDTNHRLPQQGMLWFFYDAKQETYGEDPQDAGGWSVLYSSDIQHLQPARVPTSLPQEARFKTSTVGFDAMSTMSQQPQLEIADLAWNNDDQAKYDTVYASFTGKPSTQPHHQMLGYPETLQDDMRLQCQMMTNGITDADDPKVAELSKSANEWQLLLQVDSDERINMNWPGSGMLYYWIKLADLQAQKFDSTWLVAQSS
ncbi:YwqG family protein [Dictyobacter aurantiacus]|uniref:DUF1963 domain-containing protein n=1 Tax=Dictyobacter aurantiacus TaxID=1936993 RepID=A0A401ZQE5_9CHLR|nr:YwqG family protein [Dictyobacter aurantiacus]GCE09097.1 hypothetical protein KDAU_64260 [Dictyobacter aurantiacus]